MRSTDNVSAFQKWKSSGKQATIALIFRFKFCWGLPGETQENEQELRALWHGINILLM